MKEGLVYLGVIGRVYERVGCWKIVVSGVKKKKRKREACPRMNRFYIWRTRK